MGKEIFPAISRLQSSTAFCRLGCPFFDDQKKTCSAATGLLTPGSNYQENYCTSDDYDDCPLFLCQALRSSQPLGRDRDSISLSGK
jgi:hypothetical protein